MKYSLLFLGVLAWTTAHTATANPCPSTVWVEGDDTWVDNWTPDSDGKYRVQYTNPNDHHLVGAVGETRRYTWIGPEEYRTMDAAHTQLYNFGNWHDDDVCTVPPCAPHEVVQGDGVTCVPCAEGKENPDYGATCTNCAPGKFKDLADATACQNCPAGQENNAANTGCQPCSTGEYSVAGGVCFAYGVIADQNVLTNALSQCPNQDCDAGSTHGAIGTWDVSRVTSMRDSECSSSRILFSISFV